MMAAPLVAMLLAGPAPAQPAAQTPAAVVRSKEWVIKRSPTREDEFIGDVRYQAGPTKLTADWARYRHDSKLWAARGAVALTRALSDGSSAHASGASASFDEKARSGALLPAGSALVQFERRPVDGSESDRAEGERLEWDGEHAARLTGRVRVWGPRVRARAERADYAAGPAERRVDLRGGRPVLEKAAGPDWTGALRADSASAVEASGAKDAARVSADGNVVGWLRFDKMPREGSR